MMRVLLYSRQDCHLCGEARQMLTELQTDFAYEVVEIDVDGSPEAARQYVEAVPVVEIGPYRLKAPFTRQELQLTLAAAHDRAAHISQIDKVAMEKMMEQGQGWTRADGFSYWISRHYMTMFNLFVLLYAGLAFMAPVFMKINATLPAEVLYRGYSLICHQLAYRSFFLFGEQWVYPRAAAGMEGLMSFGQATGFEEDNSPEAIFAARDYRGNPAVGYKVALCERDVAIYGAILLFGLLFVVFRHRIPPIPWYVWVLVGIVPLGMDGVSQLISQPPINLIPYRESTPYLRVLTGGLFGFFTAWFGYPLVEETMVETRQVLGAKFQRYQAIMAGRVVSPRQG